MIQEQIYEIEDGIRELRAANAERFTIKSLERTKRGLELRLQKLQAADRKDDVVTFEQLGIDRLYVDEAHSYKNLFLYTKMRNVAGLSTSDAQKSSDMLLKCRYIDEITDGKGVVFATGTPVSNSMTELFTMMRYLQHDLLQQKGLAHFDCWASTFGETTTTIELAPEGTGYRARTRFAKFYNLPELMSMFKIAADIKTADQLHLPRPEAVYHTEVSQPTAIQKEMVQMLSERAAKVHSGTVDPSNDNMLKITSDGRKLGLDQRIINPDLPDDPSSKVNRCVDNIFRIWQDGQADKLTQLVFCDVGTPKAGKFNVYDEIRNVLLAKGVPESEIAFVHDATSEAQRQELFERTRQGKVRILIGSTGKLGTGVNVQNKVISIDHLDCPWKPSDITQRNGRGVRQGNENPEIMIKQFVAKGTFDAYLWQIQEQKLRYITQILTGKHIARSCEDVDETVLSAAQFKAAATDNPMVAQKMELENRVTELKILRGAWSNEQLSLERKISTIYPGQIKRYEKEIDQIGEDIKLLNQSAGSDFSIVLDGKRYTERSEAGEAFGLLYRMIKEGAKDDSEEFEIGAYRSFPLYLSVGYVSRLVLRYNHHYTTEVGTSALGAITRIEHLAERIPGYLKEAQRELEEVQKQLAVAQQQVGQPFIYEDELSEKVAQLTEINTKLEFESLQESEVILDENGQRSDGEEDWDSERVPSCASAEV